jgi:hypothetical protein
VTTLFIHNLLSAIIKPIEIEGREHKLIITVFMNGHVTKDKQHPSSASTYIWEPFLRANIKYVGICVIAVF